MTVDPSSFRDPAGFIFYRDDVLLRQVNSSYRESYDRLMSSGLYEALVRRGLLVRHDEVGLEHAATQDAYKVIRPERLNTITYPFEWCFSQLKDAAIATLEIERQALEFGMTLKDASAYNMQMANGSMTMIDTLSLENYRENEPWAAYRQFCQHFLAPLALAAMRDIRLLQLMRVHIDGIPLDLASKLLPRRTRCFPRILAHIHLHARSLERHSASEESAARRRVIPKISKTGRIGLVESLEKAVRKLSIGDLRTEWAEYYGATNYDDVAMQSKLRSVAELLRAIDPKPAHVTDLGANTGRFSRLACELGCDVISADVDPMAVEYNYRQVRSEKSSNPVPVLVDLTNPPDSIGWNNQERMAFFDRVPRETMLALALIHHLAIGNNVTLSRLAAFFHQHCRHLVVEFVPKSDSQVRRMLSSREDIFSEYTRSGFEEEFSKCFEIVDSRAVEHSDRIIYLMQARS